MHDNFKNSKFFNEEGHLTDETVALYVDGMKLDMTDKLPEELQIHLQQCANCKKEVFILYSAVKDFSVELQDVPFFYEQESVAKTLMHNEEVNRVSIWQNWVKVAAIFLVVIGIAFAMFLLSNSKNNKDLIAFKELPEMEDLIATKYRNEKIKIISPKIGERFDNEILFEWNIKTDKNLYLQILNNKGKTINGLEHILIDNNKYVLNKKLNPGLYYWKLISEGDIVTGGDVLYYGKFYYGK